MQLKMNLFTVLALAILLLACNKPSTSSHSTPSDSAQVLPTSDSLPPTGNPALETRSTGYETLMNLEMVEYCLPYPSEFKEDYKAAADKGHHVFVSKDKQIRILYAGMFLGEEFDVIYHDAEAEIMEITMADPLVNEKTDEYFVLSWKEDEKIIWMKKWHREDDGETVTVRFEYPEAQRAYMKDVIAVVTAASTRCE